MKGFISIFLIISCIAVISLKDTFRSIHSLLHHIPNPFHTHHHIHNHSHGHDHHAHHSKDEHAHGSGHHHVHHHSSEGHQHYSESSFDEKPVNESDHLSHDHDVLEHFGLKNQKEESASGERKQREKKTFKFQWYPGIYYQYDFNLDESLSEVYLLGSNTFFLTYNQSPPSPPPEITLS